MIYLDHNATTVISKSVLTAMQEVYSLDYINPSSVHSAGKQAKKLYQKAKEDILYCLNADGYDLVFTASGTEANNLALHGKKVLTTATEHESIKNQSIEKEIIPVNSNGLIDVSTFQKMAETNDFSSIIWANNQTGIVQNMQALIEVKGNCQLHTDAVQYVGKRLINLKETPVDAITISGHKIHAPHGIACLVFRKNFPIKKMIYGGLQENGNRAGTHNLPAIVGFAHALIEVNSAKYIKNYCSYTQKLTNFITNFVQNYGGKIVACNVDRISNTLCIIKKGVLTTEQLLVMDINQICVSAGSACSAGVVGKSYVLQAMGLSDDEISCAIRVSLDTSNTMQEAEEFCKVWKSL